MTPNSWVLDGELDVQEFRDAVPRVAELVCTIEARLNSLLQSRPTGRATCDKRLKVDSAAVSAGQIEANVSNGLPCETWLRRRFIEALHT